MIMIRVTMVWKRNRISKAKLIPKFSLTLERDILVMVGKAKSFFSNTNKSDERLFSGLVVVKINANFSSYRNIEILIWNWSIRDSNPEAREAPNGPRLRSDRQNEIQLRSTFTLQHLSNVRLSLRYHPLHQQPAIDDGVTDHLPTVTSSLRHEILQQQV